MIILNQVLIWSLEIASVQDVSTCRCVSVCVCPPQATKNYSHEKKPILLITNPKAFQPMLVYYSNAMCIKKLFSANEMMIHWKKIEVFYSIAR